MRVRIMICLGIGVFVDVMLRLFTGDEGNLLVHTAVFLGSAVLALLIMNVLAILRIRVKKQGQIDDKINEI